MKHLLNFDTVAEYDAAKDNLEKPYVVTIDENNGLKYDTNVIRVPEGSGGGSTSSSWRYYDYTKCSEAQKQNVCIVCSMMVKMIVDGQVDVIGAAGIRLVVGEMVAFAVDASQSFISGGKKIAVSEFITMSEQYYGKLPEITEEEFFTL